MVHLMAVELTGNPQVAEGSESCGLTWLRASQPRGTVRTL